MTFDLYTIFLIVGVPAIAAVLLLTFGFCRMAASAAARKRPRSLALLKATSLPTSNP